MTPYHTHENMKSESTALVEANSNFVNFEEIGKPENSWPIGLLTITNGSQEVGRAAALSFTTKSLSLNTRNKYKDMLLIRRDICDN